MREEMASSSSLCVYVCASVFVCMCVRTGLCVSRSQPWSQLSPLTAKGTICSLFLCDGRPVIFHHYLGTLKETSRPKWRAERLQEKTETEEKRGENGVGVGRWVVVGFGGVGPKIRREMRKENEKNCLPKLWWDATITQAWMRREIRAEENWKETDRKGRVERQREMEKIGRRNECIIFHLKNYLPCLVWCHYFQHILKCVTVQLFFSFWHTVLTLYTYNHKIT